VRRLSVRRLLAHLFTRSHYGLVWDWEARTHRRARVSVCGLDDLKEYERSGISTAGDVAELTHMRPTDVALEIGCGTGRIGRHLAPRCRHWIGTDASERMLRHAKRELAGFSNVSFQQVSGYDLTGIADVSVDIVYCSGVFMHIDEWDRYRYVTEAYRVLKPGGRLYVDNFDLLSPAGWRLFQELAAIPPKDRPLNISKSSTPDELQTYVAQASFTGIRVRRGDMWVTVTATKGSESADGSAASQ